MESIEVRVLEIIPNSREIYRYITSASEEDAVNNHKKIMLKLNPTKTSESLRDYIEYLRTNNTSSNGIIYGLAITKRE